jgi:hypothetical protein
MKWTLMVFKVEVRDESGRVGELREQEAGKYE